MIKGVSDIRRLPRLGKIRLGEKALAKSGKEYPVAVDYFVCPPEVQAVYGAKPRVLDIVFPVEDKDVFFPQWYKRYGLTTGLICKGDGETAVQSTESGEMQEVECCPDECEWYAKKHCRRLASLQFMLPNVPGVGVWVIDTTSFYSIININSSVEMIRAVADRIRMIPLQLVLQPQEVQPEGMAKKKTVYIMNLIAPYTLKELISAGQSDTPIFLLSNMNEQERPDDLYPEAVLEREEKKPFDLGSTAEPQADPQWVNSRGVPASPAVNAALNVMSSQQPDAGGTDKKPLDTKAKKEQKKAEEAAREEKMNQVFDQSEKEFQQLMKDHGIGQQPAEETGQEEAAEPGGIDHELAVAWAILGTPIAKQNAVLKKPGLDKQVLLKQLQEEVERRKAETRAKMPPAAQMPPTAPLTAPSQAEAPVSFF